MLTAASVMMSGVRVAGHVHDEAMADPPRRAQAGLALDHRAHQLVGVQAALHQRLGAALANQATAFAATSWLCSASTISAVEVDAELRRRRCEFYPQCRPGLARSAAAGPLPVAPPATAWSQG